MKVFNLNLDNMRKVIIGTPIFDFFVSLHPDFSFDVFVKYCYTVNNKSIIETSIYINEDLYYEIL